MRTVSGLEPWRAGRQGSRRKAPSMSLPALIRDPDRPTIKRLYWILEKP